MFVTLSFAKLLHLLASRLEDCNNQQEKEKEKTLMSTSRNDFLQAAVTGLNPQWHKKLFEWI